MVQRDSKSLQKAGKTGKLNCKTFKNDQKLDQYQMKKARNLLKCNLKMENLSSK